MINLRYLTKRLLSRWGMELRRIPTQSRDAQDRSMHPITAEYLPHVRGALMVSARISDARGLHVAGFPFDDTHPFVRAANAGINAVDDEAMRASIRQELSDYYASHSPSGAVAAVGLRAEEAPGLIGQQSYACLVPWSSRDIAETVKGRSIAMREAGLQYGLSLSLDDGLTVFGPATPAKLDLETTRISQLVASVKKEGFRPFDPRHPLKAIALIAGDQVRWQIEEGHHRIPVAAAIGITTVPLLITQTVRRSDIKYWPRVIDGTFTAKGGEKLFDRVFGTPDCIPRDFDQPDVT